MFGHLDSFSVYCTISSCKMLGILLLIYTVDVSSTLYNMDSNSVIAVHLQNDGPDFAVIPLFTACNLFRTEHFKEETVEVQMTQEETEGQYSAINCTCMREMYD